MKRKDLIGFVEKHLTEIGIQKGQFLWQPRSSQLIVILGNALKTIHLKTNMTKAALTFEMGRLAGLAEAAGVTPMTAQKGHAKKGNGAWHGQDFAAMPA